MRILVVNDDGIFSPGIKALAVAMSQLGEVSVVAPDIEQSGVGHGITIRNPLRFKHTASAGLEPIPAYRVDGTPADCVVLGMHLLGKPDLVVSGINLGLNTGLGITRSGTVAGALEGCAQGVPAIAFSQDVSRREELDFNPALPWAQRIAAWVIQHGLPAKTFLNVNFPAHAPKGLNVTRLSTFRYEGRIVEREDPGGVPYYWIAGRIEAIHEEDSDMEAIEQNLVSVTPVHLDLTDYSFKAVLERHLEDMPPR